MVQFEELTEHIPILIPMFGRTIRVIYTGQPEREGNNKKTKQERNTKTTLKETTQPETSEPSKIIQHENISENEKEQTIVIAKDQLEDNEKEQTVVIAQDQLED